ncbi:MAG: molybdate ABC transporter substrate-binding protein [Myxococcales bacterium]|nr:molybdate ABC transporter substrate-binding protein [Myxococcales bacterium]
MRLPRDRPHPLHRLALACLAASGIAGCLRSDPAAATLQVWAAASLSEVLPPVAAAFHARGGPSVTLVFDASSRLARQIEAGAPADAFFSADAGWMDHLAGRDLLAAGRRSDLLGNRLVVIVPVDSTFIPASPAELASPSVTRIALAGATVPAGRYARAALESAGVWAQLEERVIAGDNVRTTLAWVARGAVPAGVVYATDALVEPRVKVAFAFPSSSHPAIVYPAAVIRASQRSDEAKRFLAFCRGPEARAIFAAAGFTEGRP